MREKRAGAIREKQQWPVISSGGNEYGYEYSPLSQSTGSAPSYLPSKTGQKRSIRVRLLASCIAVLVFFASMLCYLLGSYISTPSIPPSPYLSELQRLWPSLRDYVDSTSDLDHFSIIIPTYKRHSLLKHNLELYANGSVPSLSKIWVVPDKGDFLPEDFIDKNWKVDVEVVYMPKESDKRLTRRFVRPEGLRTQAVMSLDDDLSITPEAMELAFQVFKSLNAPSSFNRNSSSTIDKSVTPSLVGFSPRSHAISRYTGSWTYLSHFLSYATGRYSLILTNQAFLHSALLELYSHPLLTPLRTYVDSQLNCEDLLASILSSSVSNSPPLLVKADEGSKITHWQKGVNKGVKTGAQGISRLPGHDTRRAACLKKFSEDFFGTEGLKYNYVTATSGGIKKGVLRTPIDEWKVWEEEEEDEENQESQLVKIEDPLIANLTVGVLED